MEFNDFLILRLLHEKQSLESQLLASEEDRKEALEALSTALASAQDQATSASAQLNELKSQLPTEIDRWELEASAHAISETRYNCTT
jgi:predicted  nucleic acid-binding Zn-ribbon protein